MTKAQVYKAMKENKFIAVRMEDGCLIGFNCGMIKKFKHLKNNHKESNCAGYYPINFMEYISIKIPLCL